MIAWLAFVALLAAAQANSQSCPLNLVLLADSSTSIDFSSLKSFAKLIASDLSSGSRFAFVQYGSQVTVAIGPDQSFGDKNQLLNAIDSVPSRPDNGKKCRKALEHVATTMLIESVEYTNVVVLVTDGLANDDTSAEFADKLRQDGVRVFVVGLTMSKIEYKAQRAQLQKVAGSSQYMLETFSYTQLNVSISRQILHLCCAKPPTTLSTPEWTTVEITTAKVIEETTAWLTTPEQRQLETEAPTSECDTLSEGNYPTGKCSNTYFTCVAGDKLTQKCPGNLVYDHIVDQCLRREESESCTGKKPTTYLPSTKSIIWSTLKPVDFDCKKKADGAYPDPKAEKQCSNKYYVCSNGMGILASCPGSLYLDPESKICDIWANIPACSGQPRPTVPPTERSIFTTTSPLYDCRGKPAGVYADKDGHSKGCSERFYECIGGTGFVRQCPGGLYFDIESKVCDYRGRIVACGGSKVTGRSRNITWAPPVVETLPPVEFNCADKDDGYYADEKDKCSSIYYACTGGLGRRMTCADGLVYEPESKSCEMRQDSFRCTGVRRTTVLTTKAPAATPKPILFDCSKVSDGQYANPKEKCSQFFYVCSNGVDMRIDCPANLYYDLASKQCRLYNDVLECAGPRTGTPAHTRPTAATPTTEKVPFDCSRLTNGQYANPLEKCCKFYYVCSNGMPHKQLCAAGLYYDAENKLCDSYANVFACSGMTKPPVTTMKPIPTRVTPKPEYDCVGKTDGLYASPIKKCAKFYYQCSGGHSSKINCPKSLYFDVTKMQCDRFAYVFACSGKPAPTQRVTLPTTMSPRSIEKIPIDCKNKPNGDYANPSEKCSPIYFTCSNLQGFRRDCPPGTYFDAEVRACDLFVNVPACSGQPRPSTLKPTNRPTAEPRRFDFDCKRKDDGNYAAGKCKHHFWSCVGGVTFKSNCPPGTSYDEEMNLCDLKENIPACGGARPTPTVEPKPTQPLPSYGSLFDCEKRSDGRYSDPKKPCSDIFYVCVGGRTHRLKCPRNLFFDSKRNLCDFTELVPECGGSDKPIKKTTEAPIITETPVERLLETTTAPQPMPAVTDAQTSQVMWQTTVETIEELPTTTAQSYGGVTDAKTTTAQSYGGETEAPMTAGYGDSQAETTTVFVEPPVTQPETTLKPETTVAVETSPMTTVLVTEEIVTEPSTVTPAERELTTEASYGDQQQPSTIEPTTGAGYGNEEPIETSSQKPVVETTIELQTGEPRIETPMATEMPSTELPITDAPQPTTVVVPETTKAAEESGYQPIDKMPIKP